MTNPSSAPGPVTERDRILALDLLRGIAVLGILFVNMAFFAGPIAQTMLPTRLADETLVDRIAWAFVTVFCEFKFISLFSMLFGAGLALQMDRAVAAGRRFVPTYLRRLGILAVVGLFHALALWYGDILFIYSVAGLVLMLVLLLRPTQPVLIGLGLAGVIISNVLMTGLSGLQMEFERNQPPAAKTEEPPSPLTGMEAMKAAQFDMRTDTWMTAETLAYRDGPLRDAQTFRSVTYAIIVPSMALVYSWRLLGMFFLGAGLMRAGFFEGRHPKRLRMMAAVGLSVGLLLEVVAVAGIWNSGFEVSWTYIAARGLHDIASFVLALGYASIVVILAKRAVVAKWGMPLVRTGRMALTNYLLETLLATFLMYWWGLGWFGSVSHAEQVGLTLAICAPLVLFSTVWLSFFKMGPLEWCWRCLTYWRVLPNRR